MVIDKIRERGNRAVGDNRIAGVDCEGLAVDQHRAARLPMGFVDLAGLTL